MFVGVSYGSIKNSGIKGKLTADSYYKCKRCKGICRPVDGRPENHVTLEGSKLDAVESFHYLGGGLCPGGGCELATIARTRAAWGNFFLFFLPQQYH